MTTKNKDDRLSLALRKNLRKEKFLKKRIRKRNK